MKMTNILLGFLAITLKGNLFILQQQFTNIYMFIFRYIYVIVGDYLTEEEEARNMRQKLNKCMIHEISKGWIAGELSNCSSTIDYILGSDVRRSSTRERSLLIENRKFSKEKYTINVLFLNEFENVKRCSSSQVSYVRSAISKDRSYLTTIIVVVIAMLFAFAIIIGILCW